MTSAFTPPTTTTTTTTAPLVFVTEVVVPQQRTPWEESETEDEEVKLNCVRGLNAADESDMTNPAFDDDDDTSSSSSCCCGSQEENDEDVRRQDVRLGVVHFVARVPRPNPRLLCPAASRRHCPTLSPLLELHKEQSQQQQDDNDDDDELEEEEESYVGARGVALELESDNDEEEEEQEEEDCDSQMEQESVSGSDADESDMEEDDNEEEELDDEDDDEQDTSAEIQQEPSLTLERTVFAQDSVECVMPEEEDATASVILQALQQDQDDEEISSLIDSVQEQQEEQDATLVPLMPLYHYNKDTTLSTTHTTHLIGVAKDRQEHAASVPRVKRVLSADPEQTALRGDASSLPGTTLILPKKRRKSESDQDLSSFSLGLPALALLQQPQQQDDKTEPSVAVVPTGRFLSPIISSSEELEEEEELLDGQLRYELESTTSLSVEGGDNSSPVPLLTPPESPVLCEWPSNLVVDSAMTAVLETRFRPIDDVWSEDEEEITTCPTLYKTLTTTTNTTCSPSLLTPLMRGIKVCDPFQGRR